MGEVVKEELRNKMLVLRVRGGCHDAT
jgi:hypothetical protein